MKMIFLYLPFLGKIAVSTRVVNIWVTCSGMMGVRVEIRSSVLLARPPVATGGRGSSSFRGRGSNSFRGRGSSSFRGNELSGGGGGNIGSGA